MNHLLLLLFVCVMITSCENKHRDKYLQLFQNNEEVYNEIASFLLEHKQMFKKENFDNMNRQCIYGNGSSIHKYTLDSLNCFPQFKKELSYYIGLNLFDLIHYEPDKYIVFYLGGTPSNLLALDSGTSFYFIYVIDEAECKMYFDLGGNYVKKFNDKWWYVEQNGVD